MSNTSIVWKLTKKKQDVVLRSPTSRNQKANSTTSNCLHKKKKIFKLGVFSTLVTNIPVVEAPKNMGMAEPKTCGKSQPAKQRSFYGTFLDKKKIERHRHISVGAGAFPHRGSCLFQPWEPSRGWLVAPGVGSSSTRRDKVHNCSFPPGRQVVKEKKPDRSSRVAPVPFINSVTCQKK